MFGLSKKEKATNLVEEAEMAIMMGNEALAIGKFKESLKLWPENAEAWNNLGALLGGNNDHAGARDCFAKATRLKPDYVKAWRGLAVSEKNLEHYDLALEICDKVVRLHGSADDIREDIERRQKEHIRPPKGDPNDSTTEFAKKYAASSTQAVTDILLAMAKLAYEKQLLPSDAIKNVPELCCEAESVVKSVLSAIEEDCIQREGRFNPLSSLNVCLGFCVYAGMGAALEWDRDWPGLKKTGIFKKLIAAKGIFAMDEYVTELYTGKPFEGPAVKKLTGIVQTVVDPAMAAAMKEIAAANPTQMMQALQNAILVSGIACYWFGVDFAMYKIVGR